MTPDVDGSHQDRDQGRWVSRPLRDTAVVAVALGLAVWEVTVGGARAAVLSFLGAILLSPVALRVDEARRRRNGNTD
jgi:hypothetical protein